MKRERILVVDDEPRMLHSVRRLLEDRYEVQTADTGRQALELVDSFAPDLAILDVRMPELDGFELMSLLRTERPDVDVIFMTGAIHEVDAQLIRAIRERAFYFVQKPFDRDVLLTLIERCLELRRLEAQNRAYVRVLESELDDARAFQRSLLPPVSARFGAFSLHAHYEPCARLGGDLYDYLEAGAGALAFLVADVSGHGVSAAMLTANVKSAFHDARAEGHAPLAVVERLSSSLRPFDDARFVTLFCARLDADRTLEYVNAGHPPPIVTSAGGERRELRLTGPLVSPTLAGLPVWKAERIELAPGDNLFAYTDGIVEGRGEEGFFGEERLREVLEQAAKDGAQRIERVLVALRAFADGRPLEDDLTLFALEVGSSASGRSSGRQSQLIE